MLHHRRTNRIEFYIAIAPEHIPFVTRQTGVKAPLPQSTAAPVGTVDVLHVALAEVLHQQCRTLMFLMRQQQVDIIGHQDIGMNQAAMLLSLFTPGIEIAPIIIFGIETSRAVITPLDDVPGNAGIARRVRRGIRTSLSLKAASKSIRVDGWPETVVCPLLRPYVVHCISTAGLVL